MSTRAAAERLFHDAFASPHREVRLAAIAAVADDGIELHARLIGNFLLDNDDPKVEAAIRRMILDHAWADDLDPWCRVLVRWATSDYLLDEPPLRAEAVTTSPEPATSRPSRWLRRLAVLLEAVAVGVATFLYGRHVGALRGFPKGSDAYGHVTKIQLLVDAYPHISWNPYWYGGLPQFESSYPPLFHVAGMVLVKVTGMSAANAVVALAGASLVITAVCLYLVCLAVSRNQLVSLCGPVLFLASPNLWAHVLLAGAYARVLALAMLSIAVLCTVLYAQRATRPRLVGAAIFLALTLTSHLLVGIVGCALVGLILFLAPADTVMHRVWRAAGVGLPAAGLAAFFYVPFLLLPRPKTGAPTGTDPAPFSTLLTPTHLNYLDALPAALVPVGLLAAAAAVVMFRRTRSQTLSPTRAALETWSRTRLPDHAQLNSSATTGLVPRNIDPASWTTAVACGIVGLACVAWALAGHIGVQNALYGLNTWDFYIYASWTIPVFIAGAAALLHQLPRSTRWLPPLAIGAACVATFAYSTHLVGVAVIDDSKDLVRQTTQAMFPVDAANQSNYRLGAITDSGSDWVGSKYATPIVRGYQNQGTVNVDWQFWIEQALYDPTLSADSRAFAFDWYGVKWMFTDQPSSGVTKALNIDDHLLRTASDPRTPGVLLYQNLDPRPIASATSAPPALVIGSDTGYSTLFRTLAYSDGGTDRLIPVHGSHSVDDYSLDELSRFPTVMLYEATSGDWKTAARRLLEYVQRGGHLVIEAAGLPNDAAPALAAVAPVALSHKVPIASWAFSHGSDPLLDGINVDEFPPPRYGARSPWLVALSDQLNDGAEAVLTSGSSPLIARITRGSGDVVWSGMNLPYHAASFKNSPESVLLTRLLLGDRGPVRRADGEATRPNAEHQIVDAPAGSTGVLMKETWSNGWRATVNGRSAAIYQAGPGFMYVPISGDQGGTVDLTYHPVGVDWLGAAVSVLTALLLVAFLLRRRPPRRFVDLRRRILDTRLRASNSR